MILYLDFVLNASKEIKEQVNLSNVVASIDCLIFKTGDGRRIRLADSFSVDSMVEVGDGTNALYFSQRYKEIGLSNADEDYNIEDADFGNGKGLLKFINDPDTTIEEIWLYLQVLGDEEIDEEIDLKQHFKLSNISDLTAVDFVSAKDKNYNTEIYTFSKEQLEDINNNLSTRAFINV